MNILVVRFENFPYGSAPAFRTLQILKLLAATQNDITLISRHYNADDIFINEWNNKKTTIECISIEKFQSSYSRAIKFCLNNKKYDLVLRPTSIRHFTEIQIIIEQNHIPQVFDSVEWYDPSNWRLQRLDFRYYKFQFLWKYRFHKADGIIAISRLIYKYFTVKNNNVVRIPTITDCKNTPYRIEIKNSKIKFIFAGQLDKGKDNLDTFISAMVAADPEGKRTQLDIYGPNVIDVQQHLGKQAYILEQHSNILIHGKVSQKEAQEACLNSDFSVFFRLNRRSANAGFPTKLGECMTFGTPAICNDTGDISLVLKNRVNGYLLKGKSHDEIYEVLIHILGLTISEREKMRCEARKSAEEFFHYENYQDEIKKVLYSAIERKI